MSTDSVVRVDPTTGPELHAAPGTVSLHPDGDRLVIRADTYSITLRTTGRGFATAPYAVLRGPDARRFADLDLLASVHTTDGPDETTSVGLPEVLRDGPDVVVRVRCGSTAWRSRTTVLRCRPEHAELTVEVERDASSVAVTMLDDVTVLGGRATLASGAAGVFRSAIRFQGVLVPAATEPVRLVRSASTPAVLGVVGDAAPGRLSAVFAPPPLVFGLTRTVPDDATGAPTDGCLGLSLRAPVRAQTFTAVHYEPLDGGFLLRLTYEGHTAVRDRWTSPVLVVRPADDGWGVLDDHRADLVATGCATDRGPDVPDWWAEPLFCGWGAQSARSVHALHHELATPGVDTAPEGDEDEADVARLAPTFARADVYDTFLARLRDHGLRPGTVVIDDRWQREYGTGSVDSDAWPDLRGWIHRRHDDGQRVLLWWKAWDVEGVPPEECIRDATGRPVTVDPTNPAYRARLTAVVRDLLGPAGLGADGFKIDFTQRGPSGRTLVGGDGSWGIALLHELLRIIAEAARSVRPDALLVAHAVHPGFADVCGMVRTNDVSKVDPDGRPVPVADQLTMRHAIVTRTLPHHPVDTDQWPMPNRSEWLAYAERQVDLGVPALYYVESIDRSGEAIDGGDLRVVAATWDRYRARLVERRAGS